MVSPKLSILAMVMASLFALASSAHAADAITVGFPPPAVEVRTFDPSDPPSDMPQLLPQEAAVTHSAFGVRSSLQAMVSNEQSQNGRTTSTLKVESIQVELSLAITMWLPEQVTRPLVAHEEGHRRISERFYQDGERVARNLAQKYIGQSITGQGPTPQAAREAAMNKVINELNGAYMAAIQTPSVQVNIIFDTITQHGRNTKLPADQAIRQALQQYEKEQQKKRPSSAAKGS
ncbi:MAG: hypothetical protein ACM359_01430 [Bacillota bacterium]